MTARLYNVTVRVQGAPRLGSTVLTVSSSSRKGAELEAIRRMQARWAAGAPFVATAAEGEDS